MAVFKPEDLYGAGQGAGDLVKGLASTIAKNVCDLYAATPRGFVGATPVGSGVNSFNSGLWDSFCGNIPEPALPSIPAPPFEGGQCSGVNYVVTGTVEAWDLSPEQLIQTRTLSALTVRGPIQFVGIENPTVGNANSTSVVVIGTFASGAQDRKVFTTLPVPGNEFRNLQVSVSRQDGLPDNCGSLPAQYPDTQPSPTNPRTFPYTGNDGIQRPINFSIDFDPTINGPLVRLPDIPNVCVGFGFSGIEIDLCTNKPGEGTGGDISEIEDKIDALRDILDRLEEDSKENLNKEDTDDNPPDQTDPENEPPDGGISKCVPNLRFVKVSLTNIPPNANVEVGQAGFDRIDDAGWLTFTKDGFFFPPQRIEFGGAIFEAPPGVECFTMQLRFGFTAVVTTVVKDA